MVTQHESSLEARCIFYGIIDMSDSYMTDRKLQLMYTGTIQLSGSD